MSSEENFLEKYQKVPVQEYPNKASNIRPMVSVTTLAYQHENYISKSLDGILMQQTDFDFEILIGEDESSDKTRDVCIQYAKKYPDKIRLFLHSRENNVEVYGKPSAYFNSQYLVYKSKGKYLAICEGDDFWTDPLKLQKQVDFLEDNEDYGLIYSDVNLVDEFGQDSDGPLISGYKRRYNRIKGTYQSGDIFWNLLEKNKINTLTTCVRKKLIIDYLDKFPFEEFCYDHRKWMHVASYSKIKYIKEKWGSYRTTNQGMSNSSGFFSKRSPLIKQSALINYLDLIDSNGTKINKRIFSKVTYGILKSKDLSKKEKNPTIKLFKKHPIFIFYLLNWRIGRLIIRIKSGLFN
jgi:glycosyltransferase involved in cell wall biosynthesis